MPRFIVMLAAAWLAAAAQAQQAPSPARQVELLAPQLVGFSGSAANFESLVNGLAQGTPVTLTQVGADGAVQVVTFVVDTTMSPADAARALEAARQRLIAQGISAPTPEQIALSLDAASLQVRNVAATPPSASAGASANLSPVALQAVRNALARNTAVTVPGASGEVTFDPPGRPLSDVEVNQALQLAALLLAQQGIFDPTPEQLRVALAGGTLGTAAGGAAIRGVLQGQVRNTSDSARFGTSDSRTIGTSDTPPPAGAGANANVTPSLAAPAAGVRASPARAPVIGQR